MADEYLKGRDNPGLFFCGLVAYLKMYCSIQRQGCLFDSSHRMAVSACYPVCHLITYIYQSIKLVFCKQPCPVAFTQGTLDSHPASKSDLDCGNSSCCIAEKKERAWLV
jgi:hypothetical protein